MTKQNISEIFPYISQWIDQYNLIEIGEDENTDSLVRAFDEGGLVWKSSNSLSFDEALLALDNFLEKYFEEN